MYLVTGATGYIGGRLARELQHRQIPVRCMARNVDALQARFPNSTECVSADVTDYPSTERALEGIDTAFYLIHSMGADKGFEEKDRVGAENFAKAATKQRVRRIIYLGGLGSNVTQSKHLRSRHEVGQILRAHGPEVIELRASIIIGTGSLSFELIRSLTDKLPVMITPRWVRSRAQPIYVADVLSYLIEAAGIKIEKNLIVDIGGPDVIAYSDLMREYARQRGYARIFVPVPVLTPRLSSLWLGLVTPVYARIGKKLIDGLRYDTVVRDDLAKRTFKTTPIGYKESIRRALQKEDIELAFTRWNDAVSASVTNRSWGGFSYRSRIVDVQSIHVDSSPEEAFKPIESIGGEHGWYYANFLWRIRGALDLLSGGVGMRRGRRNPDTLLPGDALDFWRVERIEKNRLLRLQAEMKVPGRAWLQFEVVPENEGARSKIVQTAIFDPRGLSGLCYWYLLYPLHWFIFRGMLRNLANKVGKA